MEIRSRILIIDDSFGGQSAIEEHLMEDGVTVSSETDPRRGLTRVLSDPPDLLIVDVAYAGIDAWAVVERIRRTREVADLPIVMVTGLSDVDLRVRSFEMGADAVVQKPYNKAELRALVRNVTRLNRFRKLAEHRTETQRALLQTERAYDMTIQGWVRALDLRDHETEGHSVRVAQMTIHLAKAAGIEGDLLTHIWRGALLHDIGKLGVPDSILKKPGALTIEERRIMEKHPMHAHEMLYPIEYLRPALPIPVYHHEKYDGTGYPFKIGGEAIPHEARLFAVVDVWDALSFNGPYRKALPQETVRGHLVSQRGTHFDPDAVDTFLMLLQHFETNVPSVAAMWAEAA